MAKPTHCLLPPALLPQLVCLALLALHQTHKPLISRRTSLSIILGSSPTETISTRCCSHLRFGKNCQQAIALSEPLHVFLCSSSFQPALARCPATLTRQPSIPPGLQHSAVPCQNIQVPWATRENQGLHCQVWHWQKFGLTPTREGYHTSLKKCVRYRRHLPIAVLVFLT